MAYILIGNHEAKLNTLFPVGPPCVACSMLTWNRCVQKFIQPNSFARDRWRRDGQWQQERAWTLHWSEPPYFQTFTLLYHFFILFIYVSNRQYSSCLWWSTRPCHTCPSNRDRLPENSHECTPKVRFHLNFFSSYILWSLIIAWRKIVHPAIQRMQENTLKCYHFVFQVFTSLRRLHLPVRIFLQVYSVDWQVRNWG